MHLVWKIESISNSRLYCFVFINVLKMAPPKGLSVFHSKIFKNLLLWNRQAQTFNIWSPSIWVYTFGKSHRYYKQFYSVDRISIQTVLHYLFGLLPNIMLTHIQSATDDKNQRGFLQHETYYLNAIFISWCHLQYLIQNFTSEFLL